MFSISEIRVSEISIAPSIALVELACTMPDAKADARGGGRWMEDGFVSLTIVVGIGVRLVGTAGEQGINSNLC